jgi:phage terminase small subunit
MGGVLDMDELNEKQLQFCREFIIDLNATQAAIRAGYSANSASQQGSALLGNPKVSVKIAELKQERCQETKITANWVLEQSKKSYEFNAQEVFDNEGNPKMVNAPAAGKFLELCGKHVDVRAFDAKKDQDDLESPSLSISFEVRESVNEVKVTNAKPE